MTIFVLILTGLCVGILSAFFGVGGGIIAIPALYTLFPKLSAQIVIGSIVSMVAINAAVNIYNFRRKGREPNWRFCINTSWSSVIGVNIGASITNYVSPQNLKGAFAIILFATAIRTFFYNPKTASVDAALWQPPTGLSTQIRAIFIGIFAGIVTGFTGLGGGIVIVPLFMLLLQMPLIWLPVYSNFMMGASGIFGAIRYMSMTTTDAFPLEHPLSFWQVGQVNWGIVLILSISAFFTSRIGVLMNERFKPKVLRGLFTLFIFLSALQVWLTTFGLPFQ